MMPRPTKMPLATLFCLDPVIAACGYTLFLLQFDVTYLKDHICLKSRFETQSYLHKHVFVLFAGLQLNH